MKQFKLNFDGILTFGGDMDGIMNWGVTLILWLQNLGSWLVKPMEFFSFLGSEEFYLMVAPVILWCWNADLGLRLGIFLMINTSVNGFFKLLFHSPRPYWVDIRVKGLAAETSFGIPSGHSQNAVVVWGTLAAHFRRRIAWVIAVVIIFLIGLSRLVLAMHYPHDVLVGWLLGGLVLWGLIKASRPLVEQLNKRNFSQQILITFLCSMGLILLNLIARWLSSGFVVPAEWINNAAMVHPNEPIAPFALSGVISSAGAFFGLAVGAIWLKANGGFTARGLWWHLVLRYLIGLVGIVILWYGLGEVFPRGEEIGYLFLRYIRYALVGSWATGIAPYLFRKLKIASGS